MFNSSHARVSSIVVHYVGNKTLGNGINYSHGVHYFSEDNPVSDILKKYFFDAFKPDVQYRFKINSESQTSSNTAPEIYTIVHNLFDDSDSLLENSMRLAEMLYDNSDHPKIKSGEFYVATLDNIKIGDEIINAIGLFKSEHKDTYLKVYADSSKGYSISSDEGINIKKLDKGVIIMNTDSDNGYLISVVDLLSKEQEAKFWKDDFLQLVPREDNFYFTHNYLDVCKGFVSEVFTPDNNAERTEQIEMLTRSFDFFSKNDDFNAVDFEKEVIGNEEAIGAFQEYKANYCEEKQIPLDNIFKIAHEAVKKQKRYFKPVIKLDRNFHVYVHGNNSLIERGYDKAKGMNYYRLFFENET